MSLASWLIIIGAVVVLFALLILVFAKQYKKVGPNEALIISGRKKTVTHHDGSRHKVGYRIRLGGGTFVMPFLETVDTLPLEVIPLQVRTPDVLTHGGIPILADATAQVKVESSEASIHIAAEQFLGLGKDGIREVAIAVLEGKMREIIGTMTIEDIYRGPGRVRQARRPGRPRGLRQDGPRPPVLLAQGVQRLPRLSRRPDQAPHHRRPSAKRPSPRRKARRRRSSGPPRPARKGRSPGSRPRR